MDLPPASPHAPAREPPPRASGDDAIEFVLALARALHRYGTPAHRLEEALRVCCERLGIAAEVFSTPTTIIMSFGAPAELRTRMMRVEGGELDMDKLARVDELADDVGGREISPAEGTARLAAITASPRRFGRATSTLMHGVTSGSVAVIFGGVLVDAALAALIGVALGWLGQYAHRSTDQARVFELVGAAVASFAATLCAAAWQSITPSLVTIAALIVLLPGMSLTVAMTELATRNLIAGTARLMSAVIVLLELVVGVALGERAAEALVEAHRIAAAAPLPEWARWGALVTSSLGMAVVVQAQLRTFPWILAAGLVGYLGTRIGTLWIDAEMAPLVGGLAVGVLGNAFARLLRRPAQVVLVPAAVLLVPGSMGFRGMAALLGHDTLTGVETVFAMFVVSTAMVAGLLVANAVVSPRRSL